MTLKDYILTYTIKDEKGNEKIAANIPDYYDRVVHELGSIYKERSLNHQRTVICPLHDDTDPSLGLMNHRFLPKVKLYHCFGCNSTGDIIRFHQRIESKWHGREISEKTACEELAQMFGIPLEGYGDVAEDDYEAKYARLCRKIDEEVHNSFTYTDYSRAVMEARQKPEQERLKAVNHACIKMIATQKQLYRV